MPTDLQQPPSAMHFASILCSRLCHDAIGPVGAIMNGVELLESEGAGDMREMALGLVHTSAMKAVGMLEFARLAYGTGGGHAAVGLRELERLLQGAFRSERPEIAFASLEGELPITEARLLLNLARFAGGAIPRGGRITVAVEGIPARFGIRASGDAARRPQGADIALGGADPDAIDSKTVQAYLVHMLAQEAGMSLAIAADEGVVVFEARRDGEARPT